MKYKWIESPEPDKQIVETLQDQLGIDQNLSILLAQRNIKNFDEAKSFFRPDLDDLHDPFSMKDMDLAVQRILTAISSNERIMIYGDYDVDGTTSVAMMYSYLIKFHSYLEPYIPDRYNEGYGISYAGIDTAITNGCTLIIALDCGIKAIDKIEYAKERGVDFIICDHHRPGDNWPAAAAVLDPKRPDCNYPFKELSGCGVGFKLMQALQIERGRSFDELEEYLDLLAISIGSDLVPITGENRILAHFGLQRINSNPRPSIALMKGSKKNFTIMDVVFTIGPRINAAGRIKHGSIAVDLMQSEDLEHIEMLNAEVNQHNETRRALDQQITMEALDLIVESKEEDRSSTVVMNAEWHKGVIGIVASRLIENYYRPTVVFTESNGVLAGSARSVKGFDVYDALSECDHILEQFGGHMYAAGMTLKPERFEEFKEYFEKVVSERIQEHQLIPEISYDLELKFSDITEKFYRIMSQMAPFGPDNQAPVFITRNLIDNGRSKIVGSDRKHLKLDLKDPDSGIAMDGISFNMAEWHDQIKEGVAVDIVYHIEENEWMDRKNLQLRILDIRLTDQTQV